MLQMAIRSLSLDDTTVAPFMLFLAMIALPMRCLYAGARSLLLKCVRRFSGHRILELELPSSSSLSTSTSSDLTTNQDDYAEEPWKPNKSGDHLGTDNLNHT